MPLTLSPFFRLTRAVVFATVCMTLATVAHAVMSPASIPAWAVIVGFAGVLLVAGALAGHERSLPTIMGGLLGGQFVLHSLFSKAASPVVHHAASGMPAQVMPEHGSGNAMTLAHIAAAILSAWWLRRGERAAWALTRRLADRAERPVRLVLALLLTEPAAPPTVPGTVAATPVPAARPGRVIRHHVVRRGPPFRSRALAH
ncbi:hypothetical protein J4573_38085 [Actinomadura barringtoniae]|uniref:MFS transporter n=1 Tax=Actinomadura barringtoniae TaxID=1427535 RepID=A0A939PIT6_9ACTN|nr:hypothetical protein [Actinomadura barringtoniae]MBO2452953.1 hypothetical protein [Actinomadura barringtoniae]